VAVPAACVMEAEWCTIVANEASSASAKLWDTAIL
jgi:hypothetical protein